MYERYGEQACLFAWRWMHAGELLGYHMRIDERCAKFTVPEEHTLAPGRVLVEVARGEDHLMWYSRSTDTVADLLFKVRDAFGEAPQDVMVLVPMGREDVVAPRDMQLQNLMMFRVMYAALPALSPVATVEALEQQAAEARQDLHRATETYFACQSDPTAEAGLAGFHARCVYNCQVAAERLAQILRAHRGEWR
jgi:hypothetical protein